MESTLRYMLVAFYAARYLDSRYLESDVLAFLSSLYGEV